MNTRTMVGRLSEPAIQLAVAAVALPLFSAFAAAAAFAVRLLRRPSPPRPPRRPKRPGPGDRDRPARAYIELEQAFFAAPVERELCREVNTAFDDASLLFFSGDFARVVEMVEASASKLRTVASLPVPARVDVGPWKMDPKNIKHEGRGITISYDEEEFPFLAVLLSEVFESDPNGMPGDSAPSRIYAMRRSLLQNLMDCSDPVGNLVLSRKEIATQVLSESEEIEAGRNPYTHRRGDIWRPFFIDDQPAPMRLFCPENREPPAAGWPLVIALHGAGGNEHMFFAAYGVGRIKHLAQQHGFVVACPQNSPFSGQGMIFDALVESIALDYPIDRSRIYLVGHSMGARSRWRGAVAARQSRRGAHRRRGPALAAGHAPAHARHRARTRRPDRREVDHRQRRTRAAAA